MSENTAFAIVASLLIGGCTVTCSGPKMIEAWKEPERIRAQNESISQTLKPLKPEDHE